MGSADSSTVRLNPLTVALASGRYGVVDPVGREEVLKLSRN